MTRRPRHVRWRAAALVLAGLLTVTLLSACGHSTQASPGSARPLKAGPAPSSGRPVYGGKLTAAIPSDPTTLDWGINTDALTIDIAQNVFELLFAPDRNWVVKPMLASGYTLTDHRRVYTISLRRGVHFQNGQLMTSADVVASIQRWLLVSGTGKTLKSAIVSVTAQGSHDVVIRLRRPQYSLISDLATFVQPCIVLPASIAHAAGAKTLTDSQIVGTGPYELHQYVHGQYITLTRFPGYSSRTEAWGGLTGRKVAYIKTLKFEIVPDDTVRLDGVQTGEWQFAATLQDDEYPEIRQLSDTTVPEAEDGSLVEYLLINSGRGPLANLKAREALNMALDKTSIAQASLGPAQLWTPLRGQMALPDSRAMYSPAGLHTFSTYDPQRARELFAEAGVTRRTPLVFLSTETYPGYYAAAETIQSELGQIGIPVKVETYDFPTMISKLSQQPGSWDLSMTAFAGQPLDPGQVLFLTPTWPGGYRSAAMNAATARYEAAASPAQAKRAVGDVQSVIWRELPDIGIGEQVLLDAASKRLKDYSDFLGQGFWNAYLTPKS